MDNEIIGMFTVVAKDEDREDASDAFLVYEPDLIHVPKTCWDETGSAPLKSIRTQCLTAMVVVHCRICAG